MSVLGVEIERPDADRRGYVRVHWRGMLIGAVLALAALFTALAAIAIGATSREPAWWDEARVENAPALAERVENAVVSEVHRGRAEGKEWSMALSAEQANAWITDRLPKWLAHERGDNGGAPDVRVWFERGRVLVGVQTGDDERVLGARLNAWVDERGALWARLESVTVGRLAAPIAPWVSERLAALAPAELTAEEDGARLIDALSGKVALVEAPAIDLEDGRRVRLAGVRIEDDRLALRWVTARE